MIELSHRFANAFFSCPYPKRARPSFHCRRSPHCSTIQFSATTRDIQFVVEVYEKNREDCQFLVDETKRHFETGIAAAPPMQVGSVNAIGPIVLSWATTRSNQLWKIVLFQYQGPMRTLVHFSALNETMELLTSISGFGDGELAQFEEIVKSLLEDLIVRPNSMWVESVIDNQKK